jgi:putative FmdB family regulatory protein
MTVTAWGPLYENLMTTILTWSLERLKLEFRSDIMPIYEYVCPACDVKFELLRSLSQAGEDADCPTCQEGAKRVLSTFACFTTDESGLSSAIGGNPCASCGAASCDTCSID